MGGLILIVLRIHVVVYPARGVVIIISLLAIWLYTEDDLLDGRI